MALINKVVFDTNMLLSCAELKIDVFREVLDLLGKPKLFVPKSVLGELEKLAGKSKKNAKSARIAKELLKKNKVESFGKAKGNADRELQGLAKKGYLVATNDRELRKRIKKNRGKCLIVRKKKFIIME